MIAQLVELLPSHVLACRGRLVKLGGKLFEGREEAFFEGGPPLDKGVGSCGSVCAAGRKSGCHGCTGLEGGEGIEAQAGKAFTTIIWSGWAEVKEEWAVVRGGRAGGMAGFSEGHEEVGDVEPV